MKRALLASLGVALLLSANSALAKFTPTAQEKCDFARVTAWKVYTSCVDVVVAKDAKGVSFDEFAAFAKCRHAYFKKWTAFQGKAAYAGTSCDQTVPSIGGRFKDNMDGTVTDNLSGLVWEKKTNDASVHDEGNFYTWSTGTNNEDGTAFTTFLTAGLNTPGFAGANGWLPTLVELQTSLRDFTCTGAGGGATCTCGSSPCIDATFGPTQSFSYWSATSYVPNPSFAWVVGFGDGSVLGNFHLKTDLVNVRAVRGGL